jgi:tRNA nucleotidyltransferase (CCA-adding enzyme)
VKIYLVGGAVRDELLDLPVSERDWVVVGATPEQMREQGYRQVDAVFPVFLHPESGEEYALARTERKTGPGYKGFEVDAGPQVTLKQDLLRRDLTINALARDEAGNLIDVCGGREDLDEGLLRHITPAFSEDPVRLLRLARFAAKLGRWGFRVAHSTHGLMKKMASSDDLEHLQAERVWKELWRALAEPQPWRFFEVLHRSGVLARLLPEVAQSLGEAASHGWQDEAALAALKRSVELSDDPEVRAAAALYPAARQVAALDDWLLGLRAGKEEAQLLRDLLAVEDRLPSADAPAALLQLASRLKPGQQPQRFKRFLLAAEALWPADMQALKQPLIEAAETLSLKPPQTFYEQGCSGAELGRELMAWRATALAQRLSQLHEKIGKGGS